MPFKIQVVRRTIGPDMPLTRPSWLTLNADIESQDKAEEMLARQQAMNPQNEFRIVPEQHPEGEAA